MEHSNGSEGEVKHVTVGLILSWIVGVILVISGIGFMVTSMVSGLLVFAGGLIMLPPVSDFMRKKSSVHLSGGVRFIIALILFGIGAAMVTGEAVDSVRQKTADAQSATSTTSNAPSSGNERLELISFSCSKEYGFSKVTGEVKNISGKSMESVVAVGNFYAEDGTFVKTADAIIDYNPVLPGQTSPFEVITTSNPEITKCKIAFKEFFGGTISTKVPSEE